MHKDQIMNIGRERAKEIIAKESISSLSNVGWAELSEAQQGL